MAERIKRIDLNNIVKDYKNDRFLMKGDVVSAPVSNVGYINVANRTGAAVGVGEPLSLSGLLFSSYEFDELISEYLTCGILCAGSAYDEDYQSRPTAIAIEPLRENQVGKCIALNVMPAVISGYSSGMKYASLGSTGFVAGNSGDYWIVGVSGESGGKVFGYLGLTASREHGHLVGTLPSSLTGSGEVDIAINGVTYSDVTCPLLRSGETIESGSKVILSKNLLTGKWQIIEAQCEVDE